MVMNPLSFAHEDILVSCREQVLSSCRVLCCHIRTLEMGGKRARSRLTVFGLRPLRVAAVKAFFC